MIKLKIPSKLKQKRIKRLEPTLKPTIIKETTGIITTKPIIEGVIK